MDGEEIIEKIQKFEKICIQAPSGLKKDALKLSREIKGKETIIISESSFGACDIADRKADFLGCQCLVHMGHSPFYKNGEKLGSEIPVFYLEKRLEWNVSVIIEEEIDRIKEKKIGIVSTVQHLHKIDEAKETLEKHGKVVKIGAKGIRTNQKGQILGCDATSARKIQEEVDAFLVIGSGKFHALKVLEIGKKVYRLDPLEKRTEDMDPKDLDREKRKKISRVLKFKEENTWGIIASTKRGQYHPETVDKVKERLESLGKEVFLIAGDRVLENDLMDFGIQVWVNTACPRLTTDFEEVTVINPEDLQYLE